MTIIRGIRSLYEAYDHDFGDIPDTDENISVGVVLESEDESGIVKLADLWPDFISLNAFMSPVAISSNATVERIECGKNLGKMSLYHGPKLAQQSHMNNVSGCCSKIIIDFEGIGMYGLENNVVNFYGKSFDDYEVRFSSEHLFEKTFLICENDVSLTEKYVLDPKSGIQLEYGGGMVQSRFYPYGGFFEYGAHPQQMESCVFRTSQDGKSLQLRVSSIRTLQNLGIDPTGDQLIENKHKFVGVKEFSPSQKMSLYDELKSGACKIEVTNKNTGEKCVFGSHSVAHVAKTNLITINFTKE
jgi:hypothetical protein